MLCVLVRIHRTRHISSLILKKRNRSEEKILGTTIDSNLKFESQVKNLWKKASQMIWALSRLTNYLNDSEKKQTKF